MTAVLPPRTALYDPAAVRDWLATIHGRSAGHIWIGSTHDKFRGRAWDTSRPWIERAATYVDQLDDVDASGIYLRTTSLRAEPEKRGGDHDSLTLPGLAADLDIDGPGHKTTKLALPLPPDADTAEAIVDAAGLPDPSAWIHSGGGLYAWWLLDQPHPITDTNRAGRFTARWQNVLKAGANRLGYHYGPVGDLSRILRIPGTVNRKPGMDHPAPCRILRDTGRRYTLANLYGALQDAEAALPPPTVTPIPTRTMPRRDDGLTPWDDYEHRTDWADILLPQGWTLHHAVGRARYWTRPGKDRRDGFSASTGKATDRDRLYLFSDAASPFDVGRPYNKCAAYTLLHFGSLNQDTFRQAGRELRRLGYGDPSRGRAAA